MTVIYDPDASFWYILSRVTGTSVSPVLCSPFFWVCVLGHAALLFVDRVLPNYLCDATNEASGSSASCDPDDVQYVTDLDWRSVQALTSLLTFFIVFYGSQSYARFMQYAGRSASHSACTSLTCTQFLLLHSREWLPVRAGRYWDYCVALGGLTMDWATLVRSSDSHSPMHAILYLYPLIECTPSIYTFDFLAGALPLAL